MEGFALDGVANRNAWRGPLTFISPLRFGGCPAICGLPRLGAPACPFARRGSGHHAFWWQACRCCWCQSSMSHLCQGKMAHIEVAVRGAAFQAVGEVNRTGAACSAMTSWLRPSSIICCTIATSSTSAATATECGSTETSCNPPLTNVAKEKAMTGRSESRLGFDSARFALSVQPETPERDQRESATSVPTPSPKLCHFRLTKLCRFRLTLTGDAACEWRRS